MSSRELDKGICPRGDQPSWHGWQDVSFRRSDFLAQFIAAGAPVELVGAAKSSRAAVAATEQFVLIH